VRIEQTGYGQPCESYILRSLTLIDPVLVIVMIVIDVNASVRKTFKRVSTERLFLCSVSEGFYKELGRL